MYRDVLKQYDKNMKDIPKFYCEFVKVVGYLLENNIGILDKSGKFLYMERSELKEILEEDCFVPVNIKFDFWRGIKFIITDKDEIRNTKRVTINGKLVRKIVIDLEVYEIIKREVVERKQLDIIDDDLKHHEFVKVVDYLLENDIGIVDKRDKFLYIERTELKEVLKKYVLVNINFDFWNKEKYIKINKNTIEIDLDAYRSIKRVLLYEELELGEDAKRS